MVCFNNCFYENVCFMVQSIFCYPYRLNISMEIKIEKEFGITNQVNFRV